MSMFRPIAPHQVLRIELLLLSAVALYYGLNGILPHQLAGSPLFDISIDNTFWLFHLTGFPRYLNSHPAVAWLLESVFVLTGILQFIRHRKWTGRIFWLLLVLLSLYIQTYSCVLTKISVVLPIVFLPWLFTGELLRFSWKLPRYYLVYMMVSAGLFKLFNGGILHPGQLEAILLNQHSDLLFAGSACFSGRISEILLSPRIITSTIYIVVFAAELSFATLLFTRRFDRQFAVILLLLCLSIYIVMRINTLEIVLLAPILLRVSFENA